MATPAEVQVLERAAADLKATQETLLTENKELKRVNSETLERVISQQKQLDMLDKKFAERDAISAEANEPPIVEVFKENSSLERVMKSKMGAARIELSARQLNSLMNQYSPSMEKKTVISSSNSGLGAGTIGFATSGVLQIDRLPGITAEARQRLAIRSLFTARPTLLPRIDFVKVTAALGPASPQQETVAKLESQLSLATAYETVQNLAIWVPASKQILTDLEELLAFIQDTLPFYVNLLEDQQFLNGDSTGENLHGIVPQAAAFDTSLLTSSWTKIDIIARAIEQIAKTNEVEPTFVVLNSKDWWDIRTTKDAYGRYILGEPSMPYTGNLWGLTPVSSNSMPAGKFLVGSGDPAVAAIRDRMDMAIDISTEHSDFFSRNMVAIRCEKRTAIIVRRPNAFISGSLNTSP